ncbi:hypothetical protein Lal_00044793 [Lupinus albus]|nr:hypothetical protein Lal_00044793 [Lupinus albus]
MDKINRVYAFTDFGLLHDQGIGEENHGISNNINLALTSALAPKTLVAFVAIGATMVGSITFTKKKGDHVKKGMRKVEICCVKQFGYLSFGGSTVICVFEKNSIAFDEDLIANSNRSLETLVEVEIVSGMVEVEGITNEAIVKVSSVITVEVSETSASYIVEVTSTN